jgi:prepilin-type N-terminal cleavage/methylation domain-containing protein
MSKQKGFTLIEIAIVLVIIGLLLGGVLKGQELINAARVRNVAAQLDGVKIAYLGFQDRYRAYPGDIPGDVAIKVLPGAVAADACGATTASFCGNGKIDPAENQIVWNQLAKSGFITGSYTGTTLGTGQTTFAAANTTNSPANPFNGYLVLVHDADYGDNTVAAPAAVLNVKTGGSMPVATVAELDRKVDDGAAGTGSFRSVTVPSGGWDNQAAGCTTGASGAAGTLAYANIDIKACGGVQIQ